MKCLTGDIFSSNKDRLWSEQVNILVAEAKNRESEACWQVNIWCGTGDRNLLIQHNSVDSKLYTYKIGRYSRCNRPFFDHLTLRRPVSRIRCFPCLSSPSRFETAAGETIGESLHTASCTKYMYLLRILKGWIDSRFLFINVHVFSITAILFFVLVKIRVLKKIQVTFSSFQFFSLAIFFTKRIIVIIENQMIKGLLKDIVTQ